MKICFGDCMGQIEINSPTAVTYLLVGNQIITVYLPILILYVQVLIWFLQKMPMDV